MYYDHAVDLPAQPDAVTACRPNKDMMTSCCEIRKGKRTQVSCSDPLPVVHPVGILYFSLIAVVEVGKLNGYLSRSGIQFNDGRTVFLDGEIIPVRNPETRKGQVRQNVVSHNAIGMEVVYPRHTSEKHPAIIIAKARATVALAIQQTPSNTIVPE